jgi:hypothetical protein
MITFKFTPKNIVNPDNGTILQFKEVELEINDKAVRIKGTEIGTSIYSGVKSMDVLEGWLNNCIDQVCQNKFTVDKYYKMLVDKEIKSGNIE